MDSHDASATAPRTGADLVPGRRAPPTRCDSGARAFFRAACSRVPERSVSSHCLIYRLVIRLRPCPHTSGAICQKSYLRIDVEKGRETRLELLLNFVLAALESVHGDVRLTPIFQFDWRFANRLDFIGGQQTQTVNQCQVCHPTIVSQRMLARRCKQKYAQISLVERRASPPGHLRPDGRPSLHYITCNVPRRSLPR